MSLFKFGWSHYEAKINKAREAYFRDANVISGHYTYNNWHLIQNWKKAIDAGLSFVNHEQNSSKKPTGKRAALLNDYADFVTKQRDAYAIESAKRNQCTGPSCARNKK